MAGKSTKFLKNKVVAKLVTENRQPCVFCQQDVDDEVVFGKLYSLGDIQCHYFCVLLSCCLVQKGKDTEGLFGFLYRDIMAEVERSKKHKCSFCGQGGASMGCCVSQCRKQFHLPCGRQKNVISLFYGNYKSFCELHAPKQKISDEVMASVKERKKKERIIKSNKKVTAEGTKQTTEPDESTTVCVICYEEVPGYPSTQTFWPPCCGRDAWLHRTCLQRMALSAGMHYLKCPLCNDKEQFYEAVCEQGYYLPDRDAAWELEQNAFAEIYERPAACGAAHCKCPFGRAHDEPGLWDIQLCLLCGSTGAHAHCCGARRLVCASCRPAAAELGDLEEKLAEMIEAEQQREVRPARGGPVMPCRMSLRRTKGRIAAQCASSSSQNLPKTAPASEIKTENETQSHKPEPITRQELNLKTPRRAKFLEPTILKDLDNILLSPIKMLEQSYMEKVGNSEETVINIKDVIEKMRENFNKPRPLCEKKKIVNEIIEDLFKNVLEDGLKSRDFAKDWSSPKKCVEITDIHENVKENEKTADTANFEENDTKRNHENDLQNLDNSVSENSTAIDDIKEKNEQLDSTEENKENVENNKSSDDTHSVNDNDSTTDHDDSSNSTFQLAPEFIANSDDSIFETPKKLKTVDIEHNSSLEISEKNERVNIDVIEIEDDDDINKSKTIIKVKQNKLEKEVNTIDTVDLETFKDQYLKEVDRFKCNFNHKHLDNRETAKLRTVIDFAVDASYRKRKLDVDGKETAKKRKLYDAEDKERKRRKKLKRKDKKRKLKLRNHFKIIFKEERKLKAKTMKTELRKDKLFKQYVLKFSPTKPKVKQVENKPMIEKPENDLTPLKRKYVKNEKSPDTLVQTSIQSFFKAK